MMPPGASSKNARPRGTPKHAQHGRISFQQDVGAADPQQPDDAPGRPRTHAQTQLPVASPDGRLDVHAKVQRDLDLYRQLAQQNSLASPAQGRLDVQAKVQRDLDLYRRLAQQHSLASPAQHQSSVAAEALLEDNRGIGLLGKRLTAAHSLARRRRLQHQQTADVVPRLDSVQRVGLGKQPMQPQLWNADTINRVQYVGIKQPVLDSTGEQDDSRQHADQNEQPAAEPALGGAQRRRLNARTQSVVASAPEFSNSMRAVDDRRSADTRRTDVRRSTDNRRSGSPSRLSPSRFARQDRPITPPGLAQSQRIAAHWRV